MDFNKNIINNDNKPFHSSGYAKVANGNRIGSTGNISFNQRQQIDDNRQSVDLYKRSIVGRSYGVLRAKRYVKPVTDQSLDKKCGSLQQYNSISSVSKQPTTPKPRSFDPFA